MKSLFRHLRDLWKADFLSPKDLLRRAIFLIVFYGIIHMAGLRDFTSMLSGTTGSVRLPWQMSAFLGITYIVSYLSVVLLVPILILAAVLLIIGKKFLATKRSRNTNDVVTERV